MAVSGAESTNTSHGLHPGSNYMVSAGKTIYNFSTLDVVIDVAGVYFPLRSATYSKNMNRSDEHGSGSLNPFALPALEQTYTGSFEFASFLVNGKPAMTTHEQLALEAILEDQEDEGRGKYFDILFMEVPGKHANIGNMSFNDAVQASIDNAYALGFIEGNLNCVLTKSGRNYVEKGVIVTQREYKFMERIPK